MIIFLRNENNKTVFELEYWIDSNDTFRFLEIHSSIHIIEYTKFLYENSISKSMEIANDFDKLANARGWLWETYFMGKQNDPEEYDNVLKELRNWIGGDIGVKYRLKYVED